MNSVHHTVFNYTRAQVDGNNV